MLRSGGADVGLRPSDEAIKETEDRLGREVWIPQSLPGDLALQFVDSGVAQGSEPVPYSILGYAERGDGGERTMTISQFDSHLDFPRDQAIPVPTGVEGVEMWTPPAPFGTPGEALNFQYIVRTADVQLLFWFVGDAEPPLKDVQELVASTVP